MDKRVLFIEDNEDTLALVSLILDQVGIGYMVARTIRAGLELVKNEEFDLILLDHRLPDGDGTDLCAQIRQSDGLTPIVFYTAAAYPADKAKGIAAGADCYLVKPNDITILADKILELINRKPSKRENND